MNQHHETALLAMALFVALAVTSSAADDVASPEPRSEAPTQSAVERPTTVPTDSTAGLAAGASPTVSRNFELPAEHHPWARFAPGAWRELRVTTETFAPDGRSVSCSRAFQTEVLRSVSPGKYSVDLHARVEISGREIDGDWRSRVLDPALDRSVGDIQCDYFEESHVSIGQLSMPCSVWELRYQSEGRKIVDRLYYSETLTPYVLRRERIEQADDPQDEPRSVETVEVEAIGLPYLWQGERLNCSCLRKIRRSGKGRSVAIALVSEEIPGGEAAVWATEWSPDGVRIRTIATELVDYGAEVEKADRGWLPRRRIRQLRRQSR